MSLSYRPAKARGIFLGGIFLGGIFSGRGGVLEGVFPRFVSLNRTLQILRSVLIMHMQVETYLVSLDQSADQPVSGIWLVSTYTFIIVNTIA